MKPQLIILLAAVTFTVAMVPKLRRAVNLEEELHQSMASASSTPAVGATSASTSATLKICKPETPCAWYIYVNNLKIIDTKIINTYCTCAAGMECQYYEDDENVIIHRCRSTNPKEDKMES